jgi:hypothetical protein
MRERQNHWVENPEVCIHLTSATEYRPQSPADPGDIHPAHQLWCSHCNRVQPQNTIMARQELHYVRVTGRIVVPVFGKTYYVFAVHCSPDSPVSNVRDTSITKNKAIRRKDHNKKRGTSEQMTWRTNPRPTSSLKSYLSKFPVGVPPPLSSAAP